MTEHSDRKARLLDVAVERESSTDPRQIELARIKVATAGDDAGAGGIVRDRVEHFTRIARLRIRALTARVDELERGDDIVGGSEHVLDGDVLSPRGGL